MRPTITNILEASLSKTSSLRHYEALSFYSEKGERAERVFLMQ
jgi:hypothetical protein